MKGGDGRRPFGGEFRDSPQPHFRATFLSASSHSFRHLVNMAARRVVDDRNLRHLFGSPNRLTYRTLKRRLSTPTSGIASERKVRAKEVAVTCYVPRKLDGETERVNTCGARLTAGTR